jgi:ATP synthase protein I
MLKTLLFQAAMILAVAAVAGLLAGSDGALSALAGGAAYFLPNLLFVLRLRLTMATSATRQACAVGFLVGEAVKLFAVIALLLILPRMIEVNWPAFIAGLFVVLFVNLFALLLKN